MTRRRATIILHWSNLILLMLLLAGGLTPVLMWGFAVSGLAMGALALLRGLMNGPGPKLQGIMRAVHPWSGRVIYLFLAYVSGATLLALLDRPLGGPALGWLYQVLFSASLLHGIFHMWRHTALGDGALRRMSPTAFHKVL